MTVLTLLGLTAAPIRGAEFPLRVFCTALGALSSDTLTVRCGLARRTVRLDSVDGPEPGQPYGDAARAMLDVALFDVPMTLTVRGEDASGWHGTAQLEDASDLGAHLVDLGFVWAAEGSRDPALDRLQAAARRGRRGLWTFADPVAPWEWRKTHPASTPAPAEPRARHGILDVLSAEGASAETARRVGESEAAYGSRMRDLLLRVCAIGRIEDGEGCVRTVDARFPLPPPAPRR